MNGRYIGIRIGLKKAISVDLYTWHQRRWRRLSRVRKIQTGINFRFTDRLRNLTINDTCPHVMIRSRCDVSTGSLAPVLSAIARFEGGSFGLRFRDVCKFWRWFPSSGTDQLGAFPLSSGQIVSQRRRAVEQTVFRVVAISRRFETARTVARRRWRGPLVLERIQGALVRRSAMFAGRRWKALARIGLCWRFVYARVRFDWQRFCESKREQVERDRIANRVDRRAACWGYLFMRATRRNLGTQISVNTGTSKRSDGDKTIGAECIIGAQRLLSAGIDCRKVAQLPDDWSFSGAGIDSSVGGGAFADRPRVARASSISFWARALTSRVDTLTTRRKQFLRAVKSNLLPYLTMVLLQQHRPVSQVSNLASWSRSKNAQNIKH